MSETKFTKGEWSVLCEIVIAKKGAVVIKPLANGAITPQEDEANAHLVAAAPEMYEMLESLCEDYGLGSKVGKDIDALLTKARGEK